MNEPSSVRKRLAEAFAERQERLAEILAGLGPPPLDGGVPNDAGTDDPEQALRQAMVLHWPKTRSGNASLSSVATYLALLLVIEEHSRGPDLRFLDAWNNAFEAFEGLGWDHPALLPVRHVFLHEYDHILDNHVNST